MDIRDVEVIAPNFKRRLSGVTSTVVQLLPLQARSIGIVSIGPDVLPPSVPRLPLFALAKLWTRPRRRRVRIWHARRNIEMLAGIVLRDLLRMPLRLVFTSAAQRHHTAWTKILIRRMDAVIATSSKSAAFLTVPHRVIMHGVDTRTFSPEGPLPAGPVAEALAGRKLVGCSGRIRPQKGTDLFVDAMIALLPRFPDWTAVITGRTTAEHAGFETDLRRKIAAAGLSKRIVFTGEVSDIAAWFRRFDLYVAPPRNEGFGLTPLEAMASGVPVVASDAGAFADLIVDGVTGRVVPVGDASALADAAAPYLADPDRLACAAAEALRHVRAHFPLEREAEAIAALYEEIWAEAVRPHSTR
ncbi:glycosyltransferase family 4 protein [Aurantimonas sp. VKM B-3413]|uniref:glycosyltransferase family 4 protein n=1 Tax=Aurantimonas sp. VKM B-3413 TaxID=2779401 RepID=UPI001E5DA7FA|nr:glycosyltransferase family 4 protein [Aurantimonas sp. VKM B-3413]MCB8838627.1 glycosyltransferase family 4 protein [Aurantimonas sp. VKM B-3413]